MTLAMLFAVETPPDPIWLRTLSTVLPVVSAIVIAVIGTPKALEALRNRSQRRRAEDRGELPSVVAIAATETAATDPVVRLLIEDLHDRLSAAHDEAAELHRLRATDAGTIARLTSEIADKESRLQECESELTTTSSQNRALIRRLDELKQELESTRRRLAICMEGYNPAS